jgi:CDP-paratose 2-epimerase
MKKKILVTGSGGMVGSHAVNFYIQKGWHVIGIDNNNREKFFGPKGSVKSSIESLTHLHKENYEHYMLDICYQNGIKHIFENNKLDAIIHTAAQPSHDYSANEPFKDFLTNAVGTVNLLELTKTYQKNTPFIFCSTNKVYGDNPNKIPFIELETRYEYPQFDGNIKIDEFKHGIDETMSIDACLHSPFGASKASADLMVQEYGRYFDIPTVCFRGGCLTGVNHQAVELHGYLSYIIHCAAKNIKYKIYGYKGKQVRDQIDASDILTCFDEFIASPKCGEIYNLGGGKENSLSILETIDLLKNEHGLILDYEYIDQPRKGDHVCYYTNMHKFKDDYPNWKIEKSVKQIVADLVKENK